MSRARGHGWILAGLATILVLSATGAALPQQATSWSGDITLTGPVTIPAGETVVVRPGTEISSTRTSDAAILVEGSLRLEGADSDPIDLRVPVQASGNRSFLLAQNTSVEIIEGEGCALTLSATQAARIENSTIAGADTGLCVRSGPHQPIERDRQIGSVPGEQRSPVEPAPSLDSIAPAGTNPEIPLGPANPSQAQWDGIRLHGVVLTENGEVGLMLSSVDSQASDPPPIQARQLTLDGNGIGIRTVEGAPQLEVHEASVADNEIGVQSSGGQVRLDHATFENNEEWDVLQTQGTGDVRWQGSWVELSCSHVDGRESYGCERGAIGNVTIQTLVIGLLSGLVYLLSEAGRYLLVRVGMGLGLFSRIPREELLDNEIRQQLVDLVEREPGLHLRELQRRLDVGYGQVAYHLNRLEDENIIESHREGLYRRFYTRHADPGEDQSSPSTRDEVLDAIRGNPGTHAAEIARELETSRQLVSYHVRELVGLAKVEEMPGKNCKRLFPTDG